jgi:hypothetical protein
MGGAQAHGAAPRTPASGKTLIGKPPAGFMMRRMKFPATRNASTSDV